MDHAAEISLAGYRIEAVAGRGGMGVVYRAVQEDLGRPVALKLIAPELASDGEFRARFARESRLAASLDHPHVIPVYEAGEAGGSLYIAMRWVDGPDLRELVSASGPLAPARAASLISQVAGALDAAHAQGLVHRDVKPANVLLADGEHAYLSDFGLALSGESADRLTRTGAVIGTASYASPEQVEGRPVDARSDVYALACVLYFALTGAPPFRRDTELATAWAQVHDEPPAVPGAPPALNAVIARGLAKDPADRPATAGELAREASAAAADGGPPEADSRAAAGGTRPGGASLAGAPSDGAPRTRHLDASHTVRLHRGPGRGRRALPWLAALLAVGAAAAVIAVLAVLSLSGGDDPPVRAEKAEPRTERATPANPPGPVAASAAGDVVRCGASGCRQGRRKVIEPTEDAACGAGGAWARLDAGGDAPLYACGGVPAAVPTRVPDLAGARLDHAEAYLDDRGVAHENEGGGTFGVVVAENWTVCDTDPPAGNPLPQPSVTLRLGRDC